MNQKIVNIITSSIDVKNQILKDVNLQKTIQSVIEVVTTAFQNGKKVLFCGNGGSAFLSL